MHGLSVIPCVCLGSARVFLNGTVLCMYSTGTGYTGFVVFTVCRSDWAFEHPGLNFDQRLGFCLRSQRRASVFSSHTR